MKKILWLINPIQFREQDLFYPHYISKVVNGRLTGVFLENGVKPGYTKHAKDLLFDEAKKIRKEEKMKQVLQVIQQTGACVNFHQDIGLPLEEVIIESRFADILLIDAGLSFDENDTSAPTLFVKNVLSRAECPVLVMPREQQEIGEVIFTYTGSYCSVFAIKQFSYLFAGLKDLRITVLYAPENNAGETLERKRFIAELMQSHYPKVDFKILRGNLDVVLLPELLFKKNAIVVCSGHKKHPLKQSEADLAIHTINLPIFITQPQMIS